MVLSQSLKTTSYVHQHYTTLSLGSAPICAIPPAQWIAPHTHRIPRNIHPSRRIAASNSEQESETNFHLFWYELIIGCVRRSIHKTQNCFMTLRIRYYMIRLLLGACTLRKLVLPLVMRYKAMELSAGSSLFLFSRGCCCCCYCYCAAGGG